MHTPPSEKAFYISGGKEESVDSCKLNAQKQEKQRTDSPLARYNKHDQPVFRVCMLPSNPNLFGLRTKLLVNITRNSGKLGHHDIHTKNDLVSGKTKVVESFVLGSETDGSSIKSEDTRDSEIQASKEIRQVSKVAVKSEASKSKELFLKVFDDRDSDLLARGITPVKPNVKDEYKEFEKLIQEDLREMDNRLEEEEARYSFPTSIELIQGLHSEELYH
ncbi:unnamed protein product [Fraxinus pennsylvanica]|uniref:Uncharacterized protein n=1 Tax=Fraxinus pennsylvanica TaxID=56036 RepID=A0AAD1YKZ9_9LAMI|nr:unnamed protein product [Fraxinus pennsylvanica]